MERECPYAYTGHIPYLSPSPPLPEWDEPPPLPTGKGKKKMSDNDKKVEVFCKKAKEFLTYGGKGERPIYVQKVIRQIEELEESLKEEDV